MVLNCSMRLIKLLEEESYMSFGTLETDEVMVNEMKDKVKKEYHKRVRKFFGKKFKQRKCFESHENLGNVGGEDFNQRRLTGGREIC